MSFSPCPRRGFEILALLIAASFFTLVPVRADDDVTGATLIVNGSSLYTGGSVTFGGEILTTNGGKLSIASGMHVVASSPYYGQVGSTLEFVNSSSINSVNTTGGSLTIGGSLIKAGQGTLALTTTTPVYLPTNGTLTVTGNNTLDVSNTSIGSGALLLTTGTTAQLRIGALTPVNINVAVGSTLNSIPTILNAVTGTTVRFLGGTLSLDSSVSLLHLPTIANLASNPVELHMANRAPGDKFVLQLSYNPTLATGLGALDDLYLGWFDPAANLWKNAIAANSDGGASNRFVSGAYNSATDFQLGTHGVDTVNHVAWAVIDHNSIFGVANSELEPPAPAPEPTTAALLIFGGCAVLLRRRHREA